MMSLLSATRPEWCFMAMEYFAVDIHDRILLYLLQTKANADLSKGEFNGFSV